MNTNNGTKGKQPVDTQTQQEIDEVIRNAAKTKPNSKQVKKPKIESEEPASDPLSTQLSNQFATLAQKLVETDKEAKELRIQAGFFQGLQQAADINAGIELGLLAGLQQGTTKTTHKLIEDLGRLRQSSENKANLEEFLTQLLADVEEKKPLALTQFTLLTLKQIGTTKQALPAYSQGFEIFDS